MFDKIYDLIDELEEINPFLACLVVGFVTIAILYVLIKFYFVGLIIGLILVIACIGWVVWNIFLIIYL